MHLGLTTLLNSVLNWQKPAARKSQPPRRRRLFAEPLETRYALAGDVVISDLPALPESQEIVAADVLPDAPADAAPTDADAAPTDADAAPTDGTPADAAPTANPPGQNNGGPNSYGGNSAPIITMFTYSFEGNWLTISGAVMDDQDPTGYLVQLTGLITATITVNANDTFSSVFAWNPAYHGSIFGQTQDLEGLFSNIRSVSF